MPTSFAGLEMIVLFTDFGLSGPYVGQLKAVLARAAPEVPVVDLFADAPAHDVEAAAYLLAAFAPAFAAGDVLLCIVDPGVGTEDREAAVACADGRFFVGPDNGLFNVIAVRARALRWWEITWRPERLSASFHGRDLFAPVAARLARGQAVPGTEVEAAARIRPGWPEDLARIVYIDRFGNAMTGLRGGELGPAAVIEAGGRALSFARTFGAVPEGAAFWYENANGLAEIAVNRGRADDVLDLALGAAVTVRRG